MNDNGYKEAKAFFVGFFIGIGLMIIALMIGG